MAKKSFSALKHAQVRRIELTVVRTADGADVLACGRGAAIQLWTKRSGGAPPRCARGEGPSHAEAIADAVKNYTAKRFVSAKTAEAFSKRADAVSGATEERIGRRFIQREKQTPGYRRAIEKQIRREELEREEEKGQREERAGRRKDDDEKRKIEKAIDDRIKRGK